MKSAGIPELALLLCSAVSLIVFFIFSLSISISTDKSFMGSTFELIMKAKSSPVFVFFVCNLIVITILLENSTSSYQNFDWFGSLSSKEEEKSEEVNIMDNMEENNQNNDDNDDDDDEVFHGYDGYDEDNDDDSEDDDLDSEVEEGDDDLKKRTEEFIAKINEAWKAERLMERQLQ